MSSVKPPPMIHPLTPSQTVGPYFAIGFPFKDQEAVVPAGTSGEIVIGGTIYDGHGEIVPDHVIETWQADPEGNFADMHGYGGESTLAGFRGFGRWSTEDGDGTYTIRTVKPGRVKWLDGRLQAPHIDVTLMARGMLDRVVTRIYFADEAAANAEDPVLATVPAARRSTLIAEPVDGGYHLDLRLQGDDETVFFAV